MTITNDKIVVTVGESILKYFQQKQMQTMLRFWNSIIILLCLESFCLFHLLQMISYDHNYFTWRTVTLFLPLHSRKAISLQILQFIVIYIWRLIGTSITPRIDQIQFWIHWKLAQQCTHIPHVLQNSVSAEDFAGSLTEEMKVALLGSSVRSNSRTLRQVLTTLSTSRLQIGQVRFDGNEVLIRLEKLTPPVLSIRLY